MGMTGSAISGVVLSTVRYGDNGIVVNVLTRESGRRAFMASTPGVKSGKGAKMAMLMPLSLIEFVTTGGRNGKMARMGQTRLRMPFTRLGADPTRRAVAIFIAELLCRTIPEDVPDPVSFDFVDAAISALDDEIDGAYNFHLWFMMHLMAHLGIGPEAGTGRKEIFDMEAGTWADRLPPHPNTIRGRDAELWRALGETGVTDLAGITMSRGERQRMIDLMSQYYRMHMPGFSQLKSAAILAMLN